MRTKVQRRKKEKEGKGKKKKNNKQEKSHNFLKNLFMLINL